MGAVLVEVSLPAPLGFMQQPLSCEWYLLPKLTGFPKRGLLAETASVFRGVTGVRLFWYWCS